MRRHTQSGSAKQIPLALNLMAGPESKSVLQTAYRRLELSRHLTFEQVMSNRVYAIGVRNLADAITRRGACGNSNKGGPSSNAVAKGMDPWSSRRPGIDCSGAEEGDL